MGENGFRPQETDVVEEVNRGFSVSSEDLVVLGEVLGGVHVDGDAQFVGFSPRRFEESL